MVNDIYFLPPSFYFSIRCVTVEFYWQMIIPSFVRV